MFGFLQKNQINNAVIEFELVEANSKVLNVKAPNFIDKTVQAINFSKETYFLLSGGTNENSTEMTNENSIVPWRLNELKPAAKFTNPRSHHCIAQFNQETIYAFGGIHTTEKGLKPVYSIERISTYGLFEPKDFWEVIQIVDPKYDFCCIKSVAIPFHKRILLFGGVKSNFRDFRRGGYSFDPSNFKISNFLNVKNSDEKQEIAISHS